MSKFITFSLFAVASSFLFAAGTKLENKYVNASYDFVDDPDHPTILQIIEKRGIPAFDALTEPEVLAPYVATPETADALLAQVKPNYGTDLEAACRISAISQYVMEGADAGWWRFWKTTRTAERRLWTEALLRAASERKDEYVVCYLLDQLRWCGFADQSSRVRVLGVERKNRHIREVCEIVAREIGGDAEPQSPYDPRKVAGKWCSLGTSITWYNDNVAASGGRFSRGYQDRVRDVLSFDAFANRGVDGGVVASQFDALEKADWYTIEHGINDWGHVVKPGALADYVSNAGNKTFAANYRILIDKIRALNPNAKIVLCTPRRGYGFGTYLPKSSNDPNAGIYLADYAKVVREIAAHEGFPVADFYANCGEDAELKSLSIDVALHPNDPGYQLMADELLRAFWRAR